MSTQAVLSDATALGRRSILTQALWISAFATATAIGARVEIPHQPIPYTLQTMFVLLAGAFLGARNGAMSQLLYLAVGAVGFPVFAAGGFGAAKFIGPTGGYLIAFPVAAFLVGYLTKKFRSYPGVIAAMFAGLLVIFTFGTLHLNAFFIHDIRAAFASGFLIFSWWDVLKLFAAGSIYFQVAKRWRRLG